MNRQIKEYTKLMAVGGGQAFPTPAHRIDEGTHLVGTPGITYLDYMAGQALAGFMGHPDDGGQVEYCAELAYKVADAMLAERDKQ